MLPVETVEAIFPSSGSVGKLTFNPMTLAHAAAMETLGVSLKDGINADNVLLCGWILSIKSEDIPSVVRAKSKTSAFAAWCEKNNPDIYEIGPLITEIVNAGFSTYVPPSADGNEQKIFTSESGFGWVLEIAERLCHEYSWTMDIALSTPLSRAYALMCAARVRNGGKNGGPDYYGRIQERHASEHFRKMRKERDNGGK